MNTDKSNLIEKIKGLFRLADPANGGTANEMEVALRKAQELMTKHGIEQMQVGETTESESGINKETINTNRKKRDEDRWIPAVIATVFGVKVFINKAWDQSAGRFGGYRHCYVFVGEELDVMAAKIALPLIYEAMKNGLNSHLKMTGKAWNTHTANSFFRGVAQGFINESTHGRQAAMKKFKQEEQDRFAIVLVEKSKRIAKWIGENMETKKGRKSTSRAERDQDALDHGRRVGAAIDFTTKLS
jgi:hypothetical protein